MKHLKTFAILLLSAICGGLAMSVFLMPHGFTYGGFTGIALIVFEISGKIIPVGATMFVINIPLYFLARKHVSKNFANRTLLCVALLSGAIELFYRFDISKILAIPDIGQNMVIYTVAGGVLMALSLYLSFYVDASTGGDDVISLVCQNKFKSTTMSRVVISSNVIILGLFAVVTQDFNAFLYSCVAVLVGELTFQVLQRGKTSAVAFEIVCDDSKLIVNALGDKLNRGVTTIKAIGMYKKTSKEVVLCVVTKRQEGYAKKVIQEIDKDCFAYSIPVKEVIGKGFKGTSLSK